MKPIAECEIDGTRGRLQLYRWGGDAPRYVAVLVHGYAEHAGRYEHVARALTDHGAVVYAADHLGHGRSEGERALVVDAEDLVADTAKVVGAARGRYSQVPLVVIGHSMGGIVATRYAQQHRDELAALVLSGPAIGGSPDLLRMLEQPEIPDAPLDPDTLSRDPAIGRAYANDPLVYRGPFKRQTLETLATAIERIAAAGDLGSLPTLWLHGDDDRLCPLPHAREAIERIRGDRLEARIYPGARHEVFNETNRDEVMRDLTAFLDRTLHPAR